MDMSQMGVRNADSDALLAALHVYGVHTAVVVRQGSCGSKADVILTDSTAMTP
jgi:hypothetical protein